jgi:hypothetical protein
MHYCYQQVIWLQFWNIRFKIIFDVNDFLILDELVDEGFQGRMIICYQYLDLHSVTISSYLNTSFSLSHIAAILSQISNVRFRPDCAMPWRTYSTPEANLCPSTASMAKNREDMGVASAAVHFDMLIKLIDSCC